MKGLVPFLSSQTGRIVRAIAGIALIVIGWLVGDTAGWIIGIIGLIPLAAGIFDFCLLAPLMGYGFWGRDIRRRTS
jgi:hypothetical protein